MKKLSLLFLLVIALFPGCEHKPDLTARPTATPAQVTALEAAGTATEIANLNANTAELEFKTQLLLRDQKLVANIDAAADWNDSNPDGRPKTGVANELALARIRLSGVTPDPEEVAAAANRKALQLAGKLDEAREAYAAANDQALSMADQLAIARINGEQADRERDAAIISERAVRAQHLVDLEAARVANQKIIDEINAAAEKKAQELKAGVWRQQALWLNILGAACLIGFGALSWLGGLTGAKKAWPLLIGSPVFFGLAQLVAERWFKWAILGVGVLGCAVGGYVIWDAVKAKEAKEQAEREAAKSNAVLQDVVPVLDDAYEKADAYTKQVLDRHVFDPLKGKMNDTEKQTVKQVRADIAAPTPLPA